jgi:hypothetical protein
VNGPGFDMMGGAAFAPGFVALIEDEPETTPRPRSDVPPP